MYELSATEILQNNLTAMQLLNSMVKTFGKLVNAKIYPK